MHYFQDMHGVIYPESRIASMERTSNNYRVHLTDGSCVEVSHYAVDKLMMQPINMFGEVGDGHFVVKPPAFEEGDETTLTPIIGWSQGRDGHLYPITTEGVNDGREGCLYILRPDGKVTQEEVGEWESVDALLIHLKEEEEEYRRIREARKPKAL